MADNTRPQDQHERTEGGGVLGMLARFARAQEAPVPREPLEVKETIDRVSSDPAAIPQKPKPTPNRRQFETYRVALGNTPVYVEATAGPDMWTVYADDISVLTAGKGVLCQPSDSPLTTIPALTAPAQSPLGGAMWLNGNATLTLPGRGRRLQLLAVGINPVVVWVTAHTGLNVERTS